MTRFRITVRGEGIELRGRIDADSPNEIERLFADDLDERAIIIASPAADDYDPFAITEPDRPPTIESSRELIRDIMGQNVDAGQVIEYLAALHHQQAYVIRGERRRADQAESFLDAVSIPLAEVPDDFGPPGVPVYVTATELAALQAARMRGGERTDPAGGR